MQKSLVKDHSKSVKEDTIIGNSPEIFFLREMISRVARSSASVMIVGPSGSGKELVARAIHDGGPRSDKSYVALNCGAMPVDLIESELFGHERGAFTGAHTRRIGRFEEAHKGTIFLDEIGDMRFDMQVKLLRVLEDGLVNRVGGASALPVDVRIISATHQNIETAISDGKFREDLFFRLGVVVLRVPELAGRVQDIPLLIEHFQKAKPVGARVQFSSSGLQRLFEHSWPGNVRELRNVIERAGVLFGGETLGSEQTEMLLSHTFGQPSLNRKHQAPPVDENPVELTKSYFDPLLSVEDDRSPINLKDILENMELERIQKALLMADGVISEAARLLTLKRTTLIEKLRKYGVEKYC
jgi:sigma-54 dependent transcriptional regulator, flagellar regulatory protein